MPDQVTEETVDAKLLPRFGPISYADAGPRARQVYEEPGAHHPTMSCWARSCATRT